MRRWILALIAGCATSPPTQPTARASARLAELSRDYWDWSLQESPEYATRRGDHRWDDRLTDLSPEGRRRRLDRRRAFLARLEAIDRRLLDGEDRVTWDVMHIQLQEGIEGDKHRFYSWDVDQMYGFQVAFGELVLNYHPHKTEEDRENLRKRFRTFGTYVDRYIANLRDGIKTGHVATKMATRRVMAQVQNHVDGNCELFAVEGADVTKEVDAHVCPAFARLLGFLRDEYLDRARDEVGIWALPGGEEAYQYRIGVHTGSSMTAQQIHDLGLAELEAIEAEMRAIAKKLGHTGTLAEFSDALRQDETQYFSDPEDLLDEFREICRRADQALPRAFRRLPRTPYEVKAIESFRARDAPAAFYYAAPDDGSRPAVFYVNTNRLEARPRYNMEALAFHEAVPGHHFQIAIAQEAEGLPAFRRHAGFTVFVEGWALYAERLFDHLGLYSDERSRFGMLGYQAWRAARLVIDTGIHHLRWTRQQAIDFLSQHTALTDTEVENEIDRYIIWPGQALAYKIGEIEIRNLRVKAEEALGDRFDLRAFHDEVLSSGAIPMSALRRKIDGFIASRR